MIMSALAGVAAALAVAIMLSIYFRSGYRSRRDLIKHGLAASAVLVLLAFVISDMRHAALAYLGINPAKPAVEFEIRLPKAAARGISLTASCPTPTRPRRMTPSRSAIGCSSENAAA